MSENTADSAVSAGPDWMVSITSPISITILRTRSAAPTFVLWHGDVLRGVIPSYLVVGTTVGRSDITHSYVDGSAATRKATPTNPRASEPAPARGLPATPPQSCRRGTMYRKHHSNFSVCAL